MFILFPLIRKSLIVYPLSDFYPTDVKFPSKPDFLQTNLPSVKSIWSSVSPALNAYEKEIDDIIKKINETEFMQLNYIKDISSKINFIPDIKYKPPLFNVSWELDEFRERNLVSIVCGLMHFKLIMICN